MDIEEFKKKIQLSVTENYRELLLDFAVKAIPVNEPIQMQILRKRLRDASRKTTSL